MHVLPCLCILVSACLTHMVDRKTVVYIQYDLFTKWIKIRLTEDNQWASVLVHPCEITLGDSLPSCIPLGLIHRSPTYIWFIYLIVVLRLWTRGCTSVGLIPCLVMGFLRSPAFNVDGVLVKYAVGGAIHVASHECCDFAWSSFNTSHVRFINVTLVIDERVQLV